MTMPMPIAAGADARSHPLIARLFVKHGYAEVDGDNHESFTACPGHTLLVFVEDPVRVKETLDLAVIVPEIARAFAGRFTVGVLLPDAARAVHPRYGFRRWPALVMLKGGRYVGAIDGLRNWDEYLASVAQLLDAAPSRPHAVGIPVKAAGMTRTACGN
jgi:hydrogenase-1 operon protein HyaE